jgi:hypothetical protein
VKAAAALAIFEARRGSLTRFDGANTETADLQWTAGSIVAVPGSPRPFSP